MPVITAHSTVERGGLLCGAARVHRHESAECNELSADLGFKGAAAAMHKEILAAQKE